LILEKKITDVKIILKDLEDRAGKVAYGKTIGFVCSELGSYLSGPGAWFHYLWALA